MWAVEVEVEVAVVAAGVVAVEPLWAVRDRLWTRVGDNRSPVRSTDQTMFPNRDLSFTAPWE